MNIERTIKAVIISPWATMLMLLYMLFESLYIHGFDPAALLGSFLVATMFIFGFVSTAYLIVIFVGLPVHWLFDKFKLTHWLTYLFTGFLIALSWQYILFFNSEIPEQLKTSGYSTYGVCSVLVTLTFWFIAVKSHNKASQSDG